MESRELKRFQNRYGQFFEPLLIIVGILLFVVPTLAVINLRPAVKNTSLTSAQSVLGVQDISTLTVTNIRGIHSVIKSERFNQILPTRYEYSTTLSPRTAGRYSKPILVISNPTNQDLSVQLLVNKESISTSEVGIIFNDVNYILIQKDGEVFPRSFTLNPGDEKTLYLSINNQSTVNFAESLTLEVNIPEAR